MYASTTLPTAVAWATDARPISARLETLCGLGDEVDRDALALGLQRERGRLAGLAHELFEQWAGEIAQVEARERGVAQVHEPQPELPALAARLALHAARHRAASRARARPCSG